MSSQRAVKRNSQKGHWAASDTVTSEIVEPHGRVVEEVVADAETAVERVAELLLAEEHARQGDLDAGDDGQRALRSVGHRTERVDRRHLEREVGATLGSML